MAEEKHDVLSQKNDVHISLHMIVRRHLPPDADRWSHEKILEALAKVTHVRLDREHITTMDLELFGDSVTNLYLQHNLIRKIENLGHLMNLQFLTLSSNQLKQVEGISHLKKLVFLDLSFNFIRQLDTDELPHSIAILNLKNNRCCEQPNYRQKAIQSLPRLRQLDELDISKEERRAAGLDESSSEDEEENNFDPLDENITETFGTRTSQMLLRSQARMENDLFDHKSRLQLLSDIRADAANSYNTKPPS